MNIQRPQPSGDDTLTLQRALFAQHVIWLDGSYRVSKTLKVDHACAILSDNPDTCIEWIGPLTNSPMLEYRGEAVTSAIRMSGIRLHCADKCRGLAVYHQCYGAAFQHLLIQHARQVAVDMIGCWGSEFRNSQIIDGHGIALRLHGSNTARISGVRFHGIGDDWPDENDTTVLDWDGKPLQTKADQRACIVSTDRTGNLNGSAWIIEAAKYPALPLICYQGRRLRLTNLHVESCQCATILKDNPNSDNKIDGEWVINTPYATSAPPIPMAE